MSPEKSLLIHALNQTRALIAQKEVCPHLKLASCFTREIVLVYPQNHSYFGIFYPFWAVLSSFFATRSGMKLVEAECRTRVY